MTTLDAFFRFVRKAWWHLTRPFRSLTPMAFSYWDGETIRTVDPRRAAWIIETQLPPAIHTSELDSKAIITIRQTFKIRSRDSTGRGLDDAEVARLLVQFLDNADRIVSPSAAWRKVVYVLNMFARYLPQEPESRR